MRSHRPKLKYTKEEMSQKSEMSIRECLKTDPSQNPWEGWGWPCWRLGAEAEGDEATLPREALKACMAPSANLWNLLMVNQQASGKSHCTNKSFCMPRKSKVATFMRQK